MTAGRWQQVERIFSSALERPPAERLSFVRQACADDSQLCDEIASMLRAHERETGLLGREPVSMAHELLSAQPGERIDRYTITRALGSGGMGRIYEARDSRLDRLVALKMIAPEAFLRPGLAERFSREALAASRLNHPNVVTVLDFHTTPQPYLVTELVEGETLRTRMPLPRDAAHDVLRQLASALAAVHRAGVIHRDVKPENVMVRPDGLVKLIDFGLAQLPRTDGVRTATGAVMGTYEYMSPEQLAGGEIDARSDVWSFGIVADELTRGDVTWRPIIRRCLERDPRDRFADGAALLDAIDHREHPHRRRALMAGGVAGLAVTAGAAAWWRVRSKAGVTVRGMTRLTDFGDVLRAALSADGLFLAAACGFPGSQRLLVRHIPSGSDVILVPPSPFHFTGVAFSPDGSFVYASHSAGQTIGTLWRYPTVGGEAMKVAIDVDSPVAVDRSGRRILFVRRTRRNSLLVTTDRESEQVIAEQPSEEAFGLGGPAWSPDESMIAVPAGVRSMRMLLVHPVRGESRAIPGERAWFVGRPAWRDRQHLIAPFSRSSGAPAQLSLVDVSTGRATALTNDVSNYFDPGIAASGAITAMRQDYFSYLSLLEDSRRVSFGRERFRYVRWAGPGRAVLTHVAGDTYNLWTIDVAAKRHARLTQNSWSERDPCWSSAAQRFAVFSDRDGEWNLWSFDQDGRNWQQLSSGKTGGMNPDWTPDGGRIVFEATRDKIYGVWVVNADGSGLRRLREGITRYPAVSPDGTRVACQYEKDKRWFVGAFHLDTGELIDDFGEAALSASPRWQPDGRALLWTERNGRAAALVSATPNGRSVRPLEEQGTVESFDVDRNGSIVYLTGVRQGDVVRLET